MLMKRRLELYLLEQDSFSYGSGYRSGFRATTQDRPAFACRMLAGSGARCADAGPESETCEVSLDWLLCAGFRPTEQSHRLSTTNPPTPPSAPCHRLPAWS